MFLQLPTAGWAQHTAWACSGTPAAVAKTTGPQALLPHGAPKSTASCVPRPGGVQPRAGELPGRPGGGGPGVYQVCRRATHRGCGGERPGPPTHQPFMPGISKPHQALIGSPLPTLRAQQEASPGRRLSGGESTALGPEQTMGNSARPKQGEQSHTFRKHTMAAERER